MKFSITTLFILVLCVSSLFAAKTNLYGIITDVEGDYTETVVHTIQIDPTNAKWIRIVKNFVYVGSSGTYDGISGFDSDNEVLYYATDFSTPFLYSSDLKNQLLLAPIALGFTSVLTIDYDSQIKRLLIYGFLKDGHGLMSYSTSGGKAVMLSSLPEYTSIASTIVDSEKQLYYVIGTNSSTWNFGVIDLNNPDSLKSSFNLKCNFSFPYSFELNALYYDSDTQNLLAVAVSNSPSLAYWLAVIPIDGKGSCIAYPMQPSIFGIATCFTYDQVTKMMWFGFAPNGASKLIQYDVNNLQIVNEFAFSDQVVLEDLQVATF